MKYEVMLKVPNPGHTTYRAAGYCFQQGEPIEVELDDAQAAALKAERVLMPSDLVGEKGYPVPQAILDKKGLPRFSVKPITKKS